ncbi:MAG: hypothetical protein JNK72_13410 [Myxococcales bacterium]|nr:hypothetical protein [Myxococcales bacterium]
MSEETPGATPETERAATGRGNVNIVNIVSGVLLLAIGFGLGWRAHRPGRGPGVLGGARTSAEDTNRDGRPDRWVESDERGRPLRVSADTHFDGSRDRTMIYVEGRLNRVDYDANNDGRYDTTDQVGQDGRVLLRLTDRDWNSIPEHWEQLDAHGRRTAAWDDANQDSAAERFRAYDPAGRVTEEGTDANGDGLYEVNKIFNTRWPEGAHPVRIERDDNRDGIFERRETYTREGVLRAVNLDTNGDGIRDHLTLMRPDGSVRKEGFDRDGDGSFEEWRFPALRGASRVAFDDDDDYDLDRWEAPGAPEGWCEARCVVSSRGAAPDAGGAR